jgi:hypothetical protein
LGEENRGIVYSKVLPRHLINEASSNNDSPPPASAEVENEWIYMSTHPYGFIGIMLN